MKSLFKFLHFFSKTIDATSQNRWIFRGLVLFKKNLKFAWIFSISLLFTLLVLSQTIPATAHFSIPSQQAHNIQILSQTSLLEQGKNYYQAGQFSQAGQVWEEALKVYQAEGNLLSQIQVYNYLALAYQELGKLEQSQANLNQSFKLLKGFKNLDSQTNLLLAQALNTQGTLQLLQGQPETAIETWKQAAATYERTGDQTGSLIAQINQAQALQTLGQYRRAKSLLETLITQLQKQPDDLIKAQGLRSLGIALQTIGDGVKSKTILEQSWAISQQLNSPVDVSAALFSIGNIARDFKQYEVASSYYQKAAELSPEPFTKIEATLNQLSLLVEQEQWEPAFDLIPEIEFMLTQFPASRPVIYARINLAASFIKLENSRENHTLNLTNQRQEIAQFLAAGLQQARQIQDARAEAYSLYQLGKLYQTLGNLTEAQSFTTKAIQVSQVINATDIVARAGVQLGTIFKQQGNLTEALKNYELAFNYLQSLRSDLVAINSDIQFDFKESIEPIYREFVSLLLTPIQGEVSQTNLKEARHVIEALQLAELDNFFQDACLDTHPVVIDEIDVQAAVIYPIILKDRLEVILSISRQPLRHYTTQLPQMQVEAILQKLYSSLSPGYPNDQRFQLSQQVYSWLIEPAETALQTTGIKTLVFVPDGFLRNLPMAALYDGQKYLVEKYRIVLSPGLQLFPIGLATENLSVLAAGLTEARQGFNALPAVEQEIAQVKAKVKSSVLLNQTFTEDNFKNSINNQAFPIVHLATHGQFSSNPEETFLLTWNDRLSIEEFDRLFQTRRLGILKPIELLVMSACQTAAGDNRATLGLAGFALRSGAKSTLATLWSVNDQSTANLMSEFYNQLTVENANKAEALQQAQLKIMENPSYKHPYFWASFVLVGNWL
jgi:CHAT domain-containing protein